MAKKGGSGFGVWQFMKWAFLVCCLTSVWQVAQLQLGHSTFTWGSHASLLPGLRTWNLRNIDKAWTFSVPAESPFAGDISTIDGSEASRAASGSLLSESDSAGLPIDDLRFASKGPLDAFAASDPSDGVAEEFDDPDAVAEKTGKEDVKESTECNDVHPNADSPDMLHVMFACDLSQIEGVQASVASVVANAADPDDLTVHVMVQKKFVRDFKASFGLDQKCWGTVTVTGVLIRVHSVDGNLLKQAVAKVSPAIKKERGAIDSIENYARFYMHLVIEKAVVVYLDADIIVQADLGILRKQLLASGKTVGFVKRDVPVFMESFLRNPKSCKTTLVKDIGKKPAYNVGVFAVNLERWQRFKYHKKVEALVAQHNQCDGKLWVGGSQPPLLLALLNHPSRMEEDYITFDSAWNGDGLGWRKGMPMDKLQKKYVLHWNGNQKPWFPNGLYRSLWLPYRERFDALMRPYGDPKAETVQWYVSTECNEGPGTGAKKGYSCEQTCAALGRTCDPLRLQAVTTVGEINAVALAAGYNCEGYTVASVAKVWDGPWVEGPGNCGYHQGPVWQSSCSIQPICGYRRFCPCKAGPETAKKQKAMSRNAALAKQKQAGKAEAAKDAVDDEDKGPPGEPGRRRATTPAPSAAQIAAYKKCPHVQVLDSWSETADVCTLEGNFGCGSDVKSMWARGQCAGMFSVGGAPTRCGELSLDNTVAKDDKTRTCQAGDMPTPSHGCDIMLLSSFFTTRKDWQREKYVKPSFSKFKKLYQTVFELGLNMTVIYDELPEDMMIKYACSRWRWEKVSLGDFSKKYGVNDVRYFFFERILERQKDWKYVFVIDAFDVQVKMNPCPSLMPGKLYVGSEREKLKGHPWMKARYLKLGGIYNTWYKTKVDANMNIMNCGISGGHRDTMLMLFRKMIGVMADPNLACRKANQDINVNMAALNYIVYNSFKNNIITGSPVHSPYKRFEVKRKDVWFIHK